MIESLRIERLNGQNDQTNGIVNEPEIRIVADSDGQKLRDGFGVQDLGTARSEIRTALALDPGVQWTMDWPVDGERLLAEERGAAEASSAEGAEDEGRATIVVAPPGTTSGPGT